MAGTLDALARSSRKSEGALEVRKEDLVFLFLNQYTGFVKVISRIMTFSYVPSDCLNRHDCIRACIHIISLILDKKWRCGTPTANLSTTPG